MESKLSSLIKNFNNLYYEKIKRPFIIAEAGVNHECNIDLAKKVIKIFIRKNVYFLEN